MIAVVFITPEGSRLACSGSAGDTAMRVAVQAGVPGIPAECGGACACATCHVHVAPAWRSAVGAASALEAEMLDYAAGRADDSRLSCQIELSPALDGLELRIPEAQT